MRMVHYGWQSRVMIMPIASLFFFPVPSENTFNGLSLQLPLSTKSAVVGEARKALNLFCLLFRASVKS